MLPGSFCGIACCVTFGGGCNSRTGGEPGWLVALVAFLATFLYAIGFVGNLSINPGLFKKLPYDPIKDFSPVSLGAYVPQLFVVHPSIAAKNITELIDVAKAQPGKINFGSPGVGSVGHLTIAFLNTAGGAKFTHVPYKGAGPAVLDLVAAEDVQRIATLALVVILFEGGSKIGLRRFRGAAAPILALGVVGTLATAVATGHLKRLRSMPEIPTVAESFPGFSNDGWYGIVAPAGTPAPIINKLNAEMKRALANAEFSKQIEALGMGLLLGVARSLRAGDASEQRLHLGLDGVIDANGDCRAAGGIDRILPNASA